MRIGGKRTECAINQSLTSSSETNKDLRVLYGVGVGWFMLVLVRDKYFLWRSCDFGTYLSPQLSWQTMRPWTKFHHKFRVRIPLTQTIFGLLGHLWVYQTLPKSSETFIAAFEAITFSIYKKIPMTLNWKQYWNGSDWN